MKGLKFLSVVLMVCMAFNGAWAAKNCKPHTCPASQGQDILQQYDGSGLCYYCENSSAGSDECAGNILVAQMDASDTKRAVKIWKCIDGNFNADKWVEQSVSTVCTNSPLSRRGVSGAQEFISNNHTSGSIYPNGDAVAFASRNDFCLWIECEQGKKANAAKDACIDDDINENCQKINGGNARTDDEISIKCSLAATSLQVVASGLSSTSNLQVYLDSSCRAECTDSGWDVYITDDWSCDDGYKRAPDHKSCVVDNEQMVCVDSGGNWDGVACECDAAKNLMQAMDKKSCLCTDARMDYDRTLGECTLSAEAELCNKIGADAEFDTVLRKCRCKDANKEPDAQTQKCLETKDAREARETREAEEKAVAEKAGKQAELKDKILAVRADMDNLQLGRSVWKNKEGNFNTARLASDSIAGVVLGTAGGLITSNIVKKNQVKGGFERLNCSIGGQTVASFGDEFSVGRNM